MVVPWWKMYLRLNGRCKKFELIWANIGEVILTSSPVLVLAFRARFGRYCSDGMTFVIDLELSLDAR